ncbi:MAG: PadR family transcriptional regulator [Bacilli bacterium]|jgi:PadR family transcriptional regulator PadR|nr:PadR family transcriptional regulator [Bacilli bacterium]
MDAQIKKGSLEICILLILRQRDCYGYEVSQEIGDLLDVKEGTIYLVLQRLEKTGYVESYLQASDSNKVRKYYKINDLGNQRANELISDYQKINNIIQIFLNNYGGMANG